MQDMQLNYGSKIANILEHVWDQDQTVALGRTTSLRRQLAKSLL